MLTFTLAELQLIFFWSNAKGRELGLTEVNLFKEIEETIDRKLTDSEKTIVLTAYTIRKNENLATIQKMQEENRKLNQKLLKYEWRN